MATINEEVISVIKIISSNNPTGVLIELRKIGYAAQFGSIPANDIEVALYQLYLADKNKFYELLKTVEWDPTKTNWTNSPENIDMMLKAIGGDPATSRINFGNVWTGFLSVLQGKDATTGGQTITEGTPVGVYIALAAVALAVVGIVIFALRK